MLRRLSITLFILFFCAACRHADTQFNIPSISSTLKYRPEWETASLTEEESQQLSALFEQEFSYLGKGAQCWVFASADDKYVIKFFKHYRMRPGEHKGLLEHTFRSYKLSYDLLRSETGVVYMHLNKTESLQKAITVIDEQGQRFKIELDDMEFLVQRKCKRVHPTLRELMAKGEVEQAKQLLSSIIKLVIACADKGIKDLDPFLRKNCGFFGDQALFIDVGNFIPDKTVKTDAGRKKEIARVMNKIMPWLKENYPLLAAHVAEELNRL